MSKSLARVVALSVSILYLTAVPGPVLAASATIIHPGDQLSVQVFGDQSLTQTVTVLGDGSIEYPLIGRVVVAGKTPPAAATAIATALRKYVRQPVVNVAIAQLGQPNILVLGDVKNPGKYQLRSDAHLSDAIAAAGGLNPIDGPYPTARVSNGQGPVQRISLENLLRKGDVALDAPLSEGDVVYVPGPVTFNVEVAGAVDHPGLVQINQGDRLSMAIAKAGNSSASNADLNRVRLIRTGADGKQQSTEINLYKALENGESAADVAMQKGDVVYVPEARKRNYSGFSPLLYLFRFLIP